MEKPNSISPEWTSDILPYSAYEPYYEALVKNDVEKVEEFLAEASEAERYAMLNGTFDFDGEKHASNVALSRLAKPLFAAATMGSVEVIAALLEEGVQILQENKHKENIFHAIVLANANDIMTKENAVCVYERLVVMLENSVVEKLLLHENIKGLRPLELAANCGCVLLYEKIHLTPGTYVTKTLKRGILLEQWIDITEYETYASGARRHRSPIYIFGHLDKRVGFSQRLGDILNCDLLMTWTDKKMKSDQLFFVYWVLVTIYFGICYFVFVTKGAVKANNTGDVDSNNESGSPSNNSQCEHQYLYFTSNCNMATLLTIAVVSYAFSNLVILVVFLAERKIYNKMMYSKDLSGHRKHLIVDIHFCPFFVGLTSVLQLVHVALEIIGIANIDWILCLCMSTACMTSIWTILFYMQISSIIGHFTIAMQRMMWVMLQFFILFVCVYLPFVHAFYRVLQDKRGHAHPEFSLGPIEHYYNTFIVSLNMIDMHQFKADRDTLDYYVILYLHTAYVFLISILFMNFLIALLSTSVSEIMRRKDVYMLVQKLVIISLMEDAMGVVRFFHCVWRFFQKRNFVVEDDRYYLVRTSFSSLYEAKHQLDIKGKVDDDTEKQFAKDMLLSFSNLEQDIA